MNFNSVNSILDFAIKKEEEASEFYSELSKRVDKKWIKDLLLNFSKEELGHKQKLINIKDGNYLAPSSEKIMDLKLAEYMTDIKLDSKLDYQEALIIAMKAEKEAFKLYMGLADATDNQDVKETLLFLAQEEAKHKLRFEIEYDENILKEN